MGKQLSAFFKTNTSFTPQPAENLAWGVQRATPAPRTNVLEKDECVQSAIYMGTWTLIYFEVVRGLATRRIGALGFDSREGGLFSMLFSC